MSQDFAARAAKLISLYNSKDFDGMQAMVSPTLDFAHFNRDFAFGERDGLFAVLRQFASSLVPDRRFLEPERA